MTSHTPPPTPPTSCEASKARARALRVLASTPPPPLAARNGRPTRHTPTPPPPPHSRMGQRHVVACSEMSEADGSISPVAPAAIPVDQAQSSRAAVV